MVSGLASKRMICGSPAVRRTDGHVAFAVTLPPGRRRQSVGSGRGRATPWSSRSGGHGAKAVVDRDAGSALHDPGQSRALAGRDVARGRVEAYDLVRLRQPCCSHARGSRSRQAIGVLHRQAEAVGLAGAAVKCRLCRGRRVTRSRWDRQSASTCKSSVRPADRTNPSRST